MMAAPKNIPEIRYAEFTGEWEERFFFDIIAYTIDFRGKTPKKLGLDWSESGYLALSALNVKDGYIDPVIDAHFGSQELYDKWMSGNELHKGQVIFTTEAPMGNVAQLTDNKGYILSQRVIAFAVEPAIITDDFLAVLLRSPRVVNRLTALSSGGTAKGVSQKSMARLSVTIPPKLHEQNKISSLFSTLDTLITLHQREHDKTVTLKKAMLEKMFPKEGAMRPEVRFAGFSGDWEPARLEEVTIRIVRKNQNLETTLPLTISAQHGVVDQITYFNNRVASRNVRNYYLIKKGEFAYNKSYSDGYPFGAVKRLDQYEMGVLSTLYIIFALKQDILNSDFLVSYYDTKSWHKQVAQRAAEGARNHGLLNISADDFFDTELYFPADKTEQQKIGSFFSTLDRLITLQQQHLTKLKNMKKALLEKMFV